jgi:hypothetical protein
VQILISQHSHNFTETFNLYFKISQIFQNPQIKTALLSCTSSSSFFGYFHFFYVARQYVTQLPKKKSLAGATGRVCNLVNQRRLLDQLKQRMHEKRPSLTKKKSFGTRTAPDQKVSSVFYYTSTLFARFRSA